jgi:hypothetical protein
VMEAVVLGFAPFKVQGSTPHGCKQFLGATPHGEKPSIQLVPCMETFKGTVHGTGVYFVGMDLKGSALEKFFDINKIIPQAHPMRSKSLNKAPPALQTTKFRVNHYSPSSFSLMCIVP